MTNSDNAFKNLDSKIRFGEAKLRCQAANNLVTSELKLLNFLERYQVGCEIDISQIEQQRRRITQAEGWAVGKLTGCETQ